MVSGARCWDLLAFVVEGAHDPETGATLRRMPRAVAAALALLTARVGDARLPILSLDFSHARVRFNGRRLTVGPVGGSLTAGAADALNAAFGLAPGTVPAGLKLGDATVRYRL